MEHQAGSSSVDVALPPVPGGGVWSIPGVDEGLIVFPIPGVDEGAISLSASVDSTTVEGSMNVVVDVWLGSILLFVEVEASESGTSDFWTSIFPEGLTAMLEPAAAVAVVVVVVVRMSLLSI